MPGCERPTRSCGLCKLHYQRRWVRGTVEPYVPPHPDVRFASGWVLDPETGCHLWQRSTRRGGYGQFSVDRRPIYAHVYAYIRKYGPVPPGLNLDHFVCDNPPCCNPDHVRPVTQQENLLRSATAIASVNARKTACVHGHEFTPENTYVPPKRPDRRYCKACRDLRSRIHSAQQA